VGGSDGSRIYAIGVDLGRPISDGLPASTGVLVFETERLEQVDAWAPTADFVSIAMSADGRFVYAAGAPHVDAAGRGTGQRASITVFDAEDGSIRLIAGQVSSLLLLFPEPIVR
jgi:hypothetical protein